MSDRQDIDPILSDWEYQPGVISARLVQAADGREVMQMRVELGILQMEVIGRPDGRKPEGAATYLDLMRRTAASEGGDFQFNDDRYFELDREFMQYYHRRICALALREFPLAIRDADHTLALMDFIKRRDADPQWVAMHEQYRPFVLYHRTQAAAMIALEKSGPEAAIEEVNLGLQRIREVYDASPDPEQYEQDELVTQLGEIKESLRKEYHLGKTLAEQLADAVAAEEYERAAKLRDEIARKKREKP